MGTILYLASVAIASISQLLLKKSANEKHESFIRSYLNVLVVSAYVLLSISMVLTSLAYRTVPLALGPIIETLGIVFVAILSSIIFKEKHSKRFILGMFFIILGVIVAYG